MQPASTASDEGSSALYNRGDTFFFPLPWAAVWNCLRPIFHAVRPCDWANSHRQIHSATLPVSHAFGALDGRTITTHGHGLCIAAQSSKNFTGFPPARIENFASHVNIFPFCECLLLRLGGGICNSPCNRQKPGPGTVSRPGLGTEKLDLHRLAQVTQHFKLPFSLKWCGTTV